MIVAMGPAVAGGGSAAGLMGGAGGYQPYNGSRTDSYGNPIPSDAGGSGIYAGKACGYGDDLCAGLAKAGDMVGQAVDGAVQNVKDTIMIMSFPGQLLWTIMNSEGGDEGAKESGTARNPNKLSPVDDAVGPHTSFRRDQNGRVTNYETYDLNPRTGEWGSEKRFRGEGKLHGGVEPPLILERPEGKGSGARPTVPRQPESWELPRRY